MAWWDKLFMGRAAEPQGYATHLQISWPAAIYAIGDVHGCLDLLVGLEQRIIRDGADFDGDKWIVTVGDLIDRGPASAGVLDHQLSPLPDGFRRIGLIGNHEVMMLEALDKPSALPRWLSNGGAQTLQSYGIDAEWAQKSSIQDVSRLVSSTLPPAHLDYLRQLAHSLSVEDDLVFVHSGVIAEGGVAQTDESTLLWARPDAEASADAGPTIIHGHTPVAEPQVFPRRINIDTGAFATGKLTAVRLMRGQTPLFLH